MVGIVELFLIKIPIQKSAEVSYQSIHLSLSEVK